MSFLDILYHQTINKASCILKSFYTAVSELYLEITVSPECIVIKLGETDIPEFKFQFQFDFLDIATTLGKLYLRYCASIRNVPRRWIIAPDYL